MQSLKHPATIIGCYEPQCGKPDDEGADGRNPC